MLGLVKLHELAAERGDGLRPEILELLASRQAALAGNVENLASHRSGGVDQAGPTPAARIEGELPEGVLPFPRNEAARKYNRRQAI